jgi:hypothetical protein
MCGGLGLLGAVAVVGGCGGGSTAPPSAGTQARRRGSFDQARVVVDFAGVDAWLDCARRAGDPLACERASAATPGGRIAGLCLDTFGDGAPREITPAPGSVAALVAQMKAWPDALAQAARFLPARIGGGVLRVFVVANGHPSGDAYVRGVDGVDGPDGALQLSDAAEPVILLNPIVIASAYRGQPPEQAASAFGVLSHELFHALFRRYRAHERRWTRFSGDLSAGEELQLLVLDEGVAHLVAREERLLREGFPRGRAQAALDAFTRACASLARAPEGSPESAQILRSAGQGGYWEKYGSITGMLLAYGVLRAFGVTGIREAVRCGPGRLRRLYVESARRLPDLPALPANLCAGAWIDLCPEAGRRHGT